MAERNMITLRVILVLVLTGLSWGLAVAGSSAQAAPDLQVSATPIPVVLPTMTATLAPIETATATRTPTPIGPALAEALEGPTNIRVAPDIEAERLGQIFPGELFPVLGRATGTLWLQIQYPGSPSGTAWVFEQVVRLTGEVDEIPNIDVFNEPTIDVNAVVAEQTLEVLAQTPGALATLTAQAIAAGAGDVLPPTATNAPLPTYTYPPNTGGQPTLIPTENMSASPEDGIPPIVPIIALGLLGSFGLVVGLLRRLG